LESGHRRSDGSGALTIPMGRRGMASVFGGFLRSWPGKGEKMGLIFRGGGFNAPGRALFSDQPTYDAPRAPALGSLRPLRAGEARWSFWS